MSERDRTFAVIVTYHPDDAKLLRLCRLLSNDARVIVVDNSPPGASRSPSQDVLWVPMGRNVGIAGAQNHGIRIALESGAETIGFFDQDSMPAPDTFGILLREMRESETQVVAPLSVDEESGVTYGSRAAAVTLGLSDAEERVDVFPVDAVNASGTVARAAVFSSVGMFDERLFIDFVDIEWCLRCRHRGVGIFVVPSARMLHRIGERHVRLGRRTVVLHRPPRAYYKLRNALLLRRYSHVPKRTALRESTVAVAQWALGLLFVRDRVLHVRLGLRAVVDASLGRDGQLDAGNWSRQGGTNVS